MVNMESLDVVGVPITENKNKINEIVKRYQNHTVWCQTFIDRDGIVWKLNKRYMIWRKRAPMLSADLM